MQLREDLVRLVLGQEYAGEVRVEPVEVGLPAGRLPGSERAVAADVREDEETTTALGPELEAKQPAEASPAASSATAESPSAATVAPA